MSLTVHLRPHLSYISNFMCSEELFWSINHFFLKKFKRENKLHYYKHDLEAPPRCRGSIRPRNMDAFWKVYIQKALSERTDEQRKATAILRAKSKIHCKMWLHVAAVDVVFLERGCDIMWKSPLTSGCVRETVHTPPSPRPPSPQDPVCAQSLPITLLL